MDTETYKEYYFQDNNEKLIFKILAETLKKNLDQILEANNLSLSNEKNKHSVFSAIFNPRDASSLNSLLLNEVCVALF